MLRLENALIGSGKARDLEVTTLTRRDHGTRSASSFSIGVYLASDRNVRDPGPAVLLHLLRYQAQNSPHNFIPLECYDFFCFALEGGDSGAYTGG